MTTFDDRVDEQVERMGRECMENPVGVHEFRCAHCAAGVTPSAHVLSDRQHGELVAEALRFTDFTSDAQRRNATFWQAYDRAATRLLSPVEVAR